MASIREKIANKIQRYLQTDVRYLGKGAFWLSVGYVFQMLNGLILATVFANMLPKEAYGQYQFILSVASVLAVFTLSGLGTALTRVVARGEEGILHHSFLIKLRWNAGIAISAFIVSGYYVINQNTELAIAFLVVGIFSPFIESFNLYQPFLVGKQKFKESVLLGTWRRPIPVIALIITIFFTKDPLVLVCVYFISQAFSAGLVYISVLYRYPSNKKANEDLVKYSKHLSFMKLVGRFSDHADKILLFHFLGAATVATYALALLPVKYSRDILGSLQTLVLPKLSKRDYHILQETLPRKILFFFLCTASFSLVYILLAPFLYNTFFPTYAESILLSQLLALTFLFLPRSTYIQAFTAHEKKFELYIMRLCIPILKITLLALLIPLYGLYGVVVALLSTEIISTILVRILFSRLNPEERSYSRE